MELYKKRGHSLLFQWLKRCLSKHNLYTLDFWQFPKSSLTLVKKKKKKLKFISKEKEPVNKRYPKKKPKKP